MRPRHFTVGREIRTLDTLRRHLSDGGWIFLTPHGLPKHPRVVMNVPLVTVMRCLDMGRLFKATPTPFRLELEARRAALIAEAEKTDPVPF